ncbi:MAG: PKD domain-containing protein [Colwellia sp.]|nr:PKD domain-containing protein [Colwellia sp.]
MIKITLASIAIGVSLLSACNGNDKPMEITPRVIEEPGNSSSATRNLSIDNGNQIEVPDAVDAPGGEQPANLIDGVTGSKFLSFSDSVTVIFSAVQPYPILGYNLISGNDAPLRDPASWTLEASNDNSTWIEMDSRSGQSFSGRGSKNEYDLSTNEDEYQYYRFMFDNSDDNVGIFQLAEIEFIVKADKPLVAVSSNKVKAERGEDVQFWDKSLANPTSWSWTFEGGTPATSDLRNPSVTFSSLGPKTVTLTAANNKGEATLVMESMVIIWDSQNPYAGYVEPSVSFVVEEPDHEGQAALERVIPDLEEVIHDISLEIAKILYLDVTEIPVFKSVTFSTGDYDAIASKSDKDGDPQHMLLKFDVKHMANKAADGDEALRNEILGILWHELTHGYNSSPRSGGYVEGSDYHSYTEGLADYIRIKAGYNEHKRAGIGWMETWNDDAYNQTSFFIEWVANSHLNIDFIYLFNKTTIDLETWDFDVAFKSIFGEDRGAFVVLAQYQDYLKTQGISPPYPTGVEGYTNFAVDDGVMISTNATAVVVPAWGAYESADKLNDNNVNTKANLFIEETWWLETYAPELSPIKVVDTVTVTFELPEAKLLQKYGVTTGNDNPHRDPTLWTISGSSDGITWTVLDTNQYPEAPGRLTTYINDIDNATKAYKFYQFSFENTLEADNVGGDNGRLIQIGELSLLTSDL